MKCQLLTPFAFNLLMTFWSRFRDLKCLFICTCKSNKKVLLRERKRHTARRVESTHSAVLFSRVVHPSLARRGLPHPVLAREGDSSCSDQRSTSPCPDQGVPYGTICLGLRYLPLDTQVHTLPGTGVPRETEVPPTWEWVTLERTWDLWMYYGMEMVQDQNHSCSHSIAVCPIKLPRKCSDIKFCCLELSLATSNLLSSTFMTMSCLLLRKFSTKKFYEWAFFRQQVKFICWLESSQQQVACYQKRSSQQIFGVKNFLSNRIFWSETRQSNMVVSLFLEILPGYRPKKLLHKKCSVIKFCWLELYWQQATCCWEPSGQQVDFICWLESSWQEVPCWLESARQQVAFCWESSQQQNFIIEHFLGNNIRQTATEQLWLQPCWRHMYNCGQTDRCQNITFPSYYTMRSGGKIKLFWSCLRRTVRFQRQQAYVFCQI